MESFGLEIRMNFLMDVLKN